MWTTKRSMLAILTHHNLSQYQHLQALYVSTCRHQTTHDDMKEAADRLGIEMGNAWNVQVIRPLAFQSCSSPLAITVFQSALLFLVCAYAKFAFAVKVHPLSWADCFILLFVRFSTYAAANCCPWKSALSAGSSRYQNGCRCSLRVLIPSMLGYWCLLSRSL